MNTISRDHPFYSARSRITRAEEKISELDEAIWRYREKYPPSVVCEPDEPDRRTKTYKFKFAAPFPESWTHLSIEVLEAARSALDQTGFAAAKVSGNTRLKRTQFPIADSFDDLNNLICGRKVCNDIPNEIVEIFRSFEPYKGGNDTLWALNKLRNSNHTELIPVQVRGANITIHHHSPPRWPHDLDGLNPVFDSAKYEIPFARGPIDAEFTFNAHPLFNIGFHEPSMKDRRHAVAFLTAVVNQVDDIICDVATACRRLGFCSE